MSAPQITSVLLAAIVGFSGLPALGQEVESPLRAAIRIHAVDFELLGPRFDGSAEGWQRLHKLAVGSDITLTRKSSAAVSRLLLSIDDAGITALNVTDPAIPPVALRALRRIASQHADYFAMAAKGGTISIDGMRLTSSGLVIKGVTVADLRRIVETTARDDVVEISVPRNGRGFWGHLGLLGGYFVGFMAGGIAAGTVCQALDGTDRCDTGAFLGGGLAGGVAGATYGFIAERRTSDQVVYRALADDGSSTP